MDYTLWQRCILFFLFSFFFLPSRDRLVAAVAAVLIHMKFNYRRSRRMRHCQNNCKNQTLKLRKSWAKIWKVSTEKKKKKAAASPYPACQLAEAVHSLQMPLRKKNTSHVTGAEILREPIRFKPFSKFCKKKKEKEKKSEKTHKKPNLELEMTFYIFCLGPVE